MLSGAALASIPLSGQLHLSLAAITFFCGYALVRLRWAALLGVPAIAAGLVAYVLAVRDTTGASGRQFRQVEHYSAHASDFFSRNTDDLERVVYLGWIVVGLAVAGLVILVVRRRLGLALVLGLGALVPILFALGSNLPGYETLWRHLPGLHHTRVPERLMPVACLALAALVAVAVSRLDWPGTAAMAALLLVVELPLGMFNETAADENNGAYSALRNEPPGRMLELPVFRSGEQLASVYLYYLMQAPREHPSGYSTTAPLEADRELSSSDALRAETCRCSVSATSSPTTVGPTRAAGGCSPATARSRATDCADCIAAGRSMADTKDRGRSRRSVCEERRHQCRVRHGRRRAVRPRVRQRLGAVCV